MALIGLAGGFAVAAGLFAFIVAIGVIQRMAIRTRTSKYFLVYENAVIWGGIIGNIVYLFNINLPIGFTGLGIYGVFAGMYVGMQAMSLAEVIKTFPIMIIRLKLRKGLPYIVTSMALGKILGSLISLCYN